MRAAGAANIVMLKVQPLGGVRAALEVAEACGLPVVVSSAVDTSVGLAAGVALAAALPELPYACGLGTMSLLAGDVTATRWRPRPGSCQSAARRSRPRSSRGGRPTRPPGGSGPRRRPRTCRTCPWPRERAAWNPSTAFGIAFTDELVRCGCARWSWRQARAAPRWPWPSARLSGTAWSGCTCGSTSVRRPSPRWAWRDRPPAGRGAVYLGHGGGQLPPGRDRGRRVPQSRCSSSPPTGRRR